MWISKEGKIAIRQKQSFGDVDQLRMASVVPCHDIMSHYLFVRQVCMMWRKNADALNLVLNARIQKVSEIVN